MRPSESLENSETYQMELFPDGSSGRTSSELSTQTEEQTFAPSLRKWESWGRISLSGEFSTLRTTESPSGGGASFSSLASILIPLEYVPTRYFLSAKAARGILSRSAKRGKTLPDTLQRALEALASSESSADETASESSEM
jgi:hypothetical protein